MKHLPHSHSPTPTDRPAKLWLRVGEQDTYHSFEDVFNVALHLYEAGIEDIWKLGQPYRFTDASQFTDLNYISLFWGDDDAQPIRELTADELATLDTEMWDLSESDYVEDPRNEVDHE
jgi:hypothetical protein